MSNADVSNKYDWRTYETPTKTTAHILEELVGDESPKSHRSKTSSTGSFVVLDPQTQTNEEQATVTPLFPASYHPENAPLQPASDIGATKSEQSSSKSHKSNESFASSVPRRISDEFSSSHPRSTTTDTSPSTEPHHGRHHAHTHSRGHHPRSRSSSESLSSLLLVTTERLSRETARANEAERKSAEIMSLFKHTFEAKTKVERDLIRVQQELEMYKIQFDAAQKEIYRAQDVVDRVERERVAAIEDAARARDKIHKLTEARAIERAMEEGRRSGFEEGLRQGRQVQPMRESSYGERRNRDSTDSASSGVSESRSRRRASSRPPPAVQPEHPVSKPPPPLPVYPPKPPVVAAPPPPPFHRHGTPPDVGKFENLLPRPTITTPMPVQVPSTQPQPPPPMPPHQAPTTLHDHSSHGRPEKIAVSNNDKNGPIHPIPVWNHTPSVMHEHIVLPPDNFIPTMDANSVIGLPPPHELSRPVPPKAPPLKNNVPDNTSQPPRSRSRGPEKRPSLKLVDHDEREILKTKNYTSPQYQDDDASSLNYSAFGGPTSRKYASGRSGGVLSPTSTHLSDLDLLSPPPPDGSRNYQTRYENPLYQNLSHIASPSPPQIIAQEWRDANREFISPPRKNVDSPAHYARPPSTTPQDIPRPPSRRPKEIVMPAPLAEVYLNTTRSPRVDQQPFSERLTPPDPTLIHLNHTPPGIEVVTPSTHASSRISAATIVDPVLLTPESANRPHPLPEPTGPEKISIAPPPQYDYGRSFPVPLSPIAGMTNLKAYPPGFAPSLPKDHDASSRPDYKYPSSPLLR